MNLAFDALVLRPSSAATDFYQFESVAAKEGLSIGLSMLSSFFEVFVLHCYSYQVLTTTVTT